MLILVYLMNVMLKNISFKMIKQRNVTVKMAIFMMKTKKLVNHVNQHVKHVLMVKNVQLVMLLEEVQILMVNVNV